MSEFSVHLEERDNFYILHMKGAIVSSTLGELRHQVDVIAKEHNIFNRGGLKIIIDYAEVSDVDSATVANVIKRLDRLHDLGHNVAFVNLPEEMKVLIQMYKVESLFQIHTDIDTAMQVMA
ncbi:MAG: anti-anti-sigma factor [Candidatus Omnitrophota bacterium]|jgi:anti-anti-sigma factor